MKNVRALKPSRPPGNERLSRLAPEQLARVSAIDLGKYRHWEHETKA